MFMHTGLRSGGRHPIPFPAFLLGLILVAGGFAACIDVDSRPDDDAAALEGEAAEERAEEAEEAEEEAAERAEERAGEAVVGGPEEIAEARGDRGIFERLFEPEPEIVTVPAGTAVAVRLIDSASSHASAPGEVVRAEVISHVTAGDAVVIPAGSAVVGEVADAHRPKIGGQARLRVEMVSLQLPSGDSVPVAASVSRVGKSEKGKDIATIVGGTAAGAILGHQVEGDDEGKVVGGLVGGGVGSAIAHRTKGRPVVIPAGTVVEVRLGAPVSIEVPA